jgi:hypothetical protein
MGGFIVDEQCCTVITRGMLSRLRFYCLYVLAVVTKREYVLPTVERNIE